MTINNHMNNKSRLLAVACVFLMTQAVSAPVLSATVFPSEVQACVSAFTCSNPALVMQAPTFSAYSYQDAGTAKFLFQYNLSPTSNETTNFSTTQFSGAAWLGADASYDLTQDRHFFTLYLDGVTPTPTNLWLGDSNGLDVGLSMTTADLLSGSSFYYAAFDTYPGTVGGLGTHGDNGQTFDGQSFFICAASTCEVGAELNLLNMQYVQSGTTAQLLLNPGDQRRLLYSQYQNYTFDYPTDPAYYHLQSYEVVPVPAAIWLFGSGLIGLAGVVRRQART